MAVSSIVKKNNPIFNGIITGSFGENKRFFFEKSSLFIAPKTGFYRIRVWGAGGGGYSDTNFYYHGGSGAFALKEIFLQKGDEIYVTIGNSPESITSFGPHVTCNGGYSVRSPENTGYGGEAFGGDINIQGNRGGYARRSDYNGYNNSAGLSKNYTFIKKIGYNNIDCLEQIALIGCGTYYSRGNNALIIVEY